MKKLVFLAAIAAMSFTTINAQEVRLGVKGGVNFATLSGDHLGDIKSRTGFHLGGLVEIPVTERFAVQPEILYSAQGAEYKESGQESGVDYSYEYKNKLDYISVPVMAKFYVVDGLAIEAGPQISFLTSSKGEYEGTMGGITVSGDSDLEDISTIDFSLGAGASYRLPMGVFFGARYNFGLSNVYDGDNADDNKIHNNVFQLSAGYSF
ncbi:MAG TPA: porin family protein [Aequorivita sp.]|nr:porin family protein [Aequorivita sp.]